MTVPDNLIERIDSTRIIYSERSGGMTINGAPFLCEFQDQIDPAEVCDTICTSEKPWMMFGVKSKISDRQTDEDGDVVQSDYWKVVGTLFEVTSDDELVGATSITLEVTGHWVRIYIKEDGSAARVGEFVEALDDEFGVTLEFPEQNDIGS